MRAAIALVLLLLVGCPLPALGAPPADGSASPPQVEPAQQQAPAGPGAPAATAAPPAAASPGALPVPLQRPGGDTVILGRRRLSLAEVLAFARASHPVLQAAAARYQQAGARLRQSLASNVPNVYLDINRTETYTQGARPDSTFQFSPTMNLAYKLYDGDRRNRLVEQSRQDLLTYEYDWRSRWRELALQIQQRYLQVVLHKALLEVSEENVRMSDDALRYARGLVRGGRRSQLDVLQAEADLSGARANWVQQMGRVNQAWAVLESAVGTALNTYAPLDDLLAQEVSIPTEGQAADVAMARRSDLLALANQAQVQRLQVQVNNTALNPTLQGVLKYGAVGDDFPLVQTWQTGLDLQLPLNVRNATESANQEAWGRVSELQDRADALRLEIRGNLRSDFVDWSSAVERTRINEKQVQEARDAYAVAERRYRSGISQYVELTQARNALNQARSSYEQARYDRRLAGFRLANEMEEVP